MMLRLLTSLAFLAHLLAGGGVAHAYGVDDASASLESRVDGEQCDSEAQDSIASAVIAVMPRKIVTHHGPAMVRDCVRVHSVLLRIDRSFE